MTSAVLKRNPLDNTIHSLVDEFFTGWPVFFKQPFNNPERNAWIPVNVKETATGYQLELMAPGFDKKDFSIQVEKNLLTVSANRPSETEGTDKYLRREYSTAAFKKTFTLDEKTDATKIEASYIHGVLVLNLPHKAEVKEPVTSIPIQ